MPKNLLTPIVAANRLIQALLASTLEQAPGASRVCVIDLENKKRLRMPHRARHETRRARSTTYQSVTSRLPPKSDVNQSIALSKLPIGACSVLHAADLAIGPTAEFLQSITAAAALVCPICETGDEPEAAICIIWEGQDRPPQNEALATLMSSGAHLGRQIAMVLELCHCATAGYA